jgi:glycosyltransferase involved in cell wall biosynthesis
VGTTDLNQLSAFFLEKSRHNIEAIKDLIYQNHRACGWLILATHDIADNPSPFGCTAEFFEEIVRFAVRTGGEIRSVSEALATLHAPGCKKIESRPYIVSGSDDASETTPEKSLVSILIPSHNAQEWIADTLRSALAQTWERIEIIVVDDGSTDGTLAVARQFESGCVRVVAQKNQGAAAARNIAFSLSRGDYIQWLDADDVLAPDKIARQMEMASKNGRQNILLSSEFGRFLYRQERAEFVPTELWKDLSPAEWLFRKLGQNLYMQTATWLVSRELTEAAGLWDTRLLSDDDGEYFCRVLCASEGVCFVPGAKVYYRAPGVAFGGSLSYIGASERKIRAHWISMQLHIDYLLSMEDSERVRAACLRYLQTCFIYYYPEMVDIVKEVEQLAAKLGGQIYPPQLSWKYAWMKSLMGLRLAKRGQISLLRLKWRLKKSFDEILFRFDRQPHAKPKSI